MMNIKMETEEKRYWIQTGAVSSVALGAILIVEHILTWGGTDLTLGHEWLGLGLVIIGTIAGIFSRKKK